MNREEVYEVIDTERKYQEDLIKLCEPTMNPDMHCGDTLLAIQYNINQAIDIWYRDNKPYANTTVFLRKIAALAVAAMEKYGVQKRM